MLSYGANRLGKRPPTPQRTFAYRRVEVLVAFFNAMALIGVAIFIAVEGVGRLRHPVPVGGATVMLIAGVGMIADTAAAWLLKGYDDSMPAARSSTSRPMWWPRWACWLGACSCGPSTSTRPTRSCP